MDRAASVTILILLLCAITAQGIPNLGLQGQCRCTRTRSNVIHPELIRSLKYIPRGSHCEDTEIIITMKKGRKVCVNPDAEWVQELMRGGRK